MGALVFMIGELAVLLAVKRKSVLCLSVCLPGLPIVVAHGHKTLLVPPVELRPPSSAQIGSGVAGFVARFIASPDGCVTAL